MSTGLLKSDIIDGAFNKMRISGLTVTPSTSDNALALEILEDKAAELEAKDISTGYNFEDTPLATSLHNLPKKYQGPYKTILALWLCLPFGKNPPPLLVQEAGSAITYLYSSTAEYRGVDYPSRQPLGSGNRPDPLSSFFGLSNNAPLTSSTNTLYTTNVDIYTENFRSVLKSGETVSSYTIDSDDGITVSDDSLTNPIVTYTITAGSEASDLQRVQIIATTSLGRIITRIINFIIKDGGL